MWNTRKFEKHLESRLREAFGKERGEELMAIYTVSRGKLVDDVYKEIAGANPDLSDHGADHVGHVLDNAHFLLSDHAKEHGLSANNLYLLGTVILFHDVGNLYGRQGHEKKIGEIFDWVRGTDASVRHEKSLVLRVVRAHTGEASGGGPDTLKDVSEVDQLHSERVDLRNVAAILRFADDSQKARNGHPNSVDVRAFMRSTASFFTSMPVLRTSVLTVVPKGSSLHTRLK